MTDDCEAEDINTRVVKEWVADTTPEERVRSIMKRTYEPATVEQVATRARVTPIRAQHLLQQMHRAGYVVAVTRGDAVAYHRGDTPDTEI